MKKLPSLSVVFPCYNDQQAIKEIVRKTIKILPQIAASYEIVVVNDGSTDSSKTVLAKLQQDIPSLRVINHTSNKGYGSSLIDGFNNASKELIFYTDGDGQYDVGELSKLIAAFGKDTDMVSGFKLNRSDSWLRKIIGAIYNQFVKFVFQLKIKDVDCDFRLFRRKILEGLSFRVASGAFDVEFIKKLQTRNVRIKEIGVHHYSRKFGQSQFFSPLKIITSLWDLALLRATI